MPSPDVTGYVDLTLEERSAQDLLDTAFTDLRARVPEYVPRETGLEVHLLEGMAEMVEQSIFAINRLPGAIFEIIMKAFGIERYLGQPPEVQVTFLVANVNGYEIPDGTRSVLTTDVGAIVFTLQGALTIPVGSSSATGRAVAEDFTSEFNGVPAGTDLAILDAVPYVDYVRTASVVASGADAETDEEYLNRGASRFSRLSETLVLPDHFVQAALENPLVTRAFALDNFDPDSDLPPGSSPGHISVPVYGDGAPLSDVQRTALEASFEAATAANLDVHVVDPTITDVDIAVTVKNDGEQDSESVREECVAAAREYISVETWPWSGIVRRNELIALFSNVRGVDYVAELTTPSGDLPLSGNAPLARAGTVTVTVID